MIVTTLRKLAYLGCVLLLTPLFCSAGTILLTENFNELTPQLGATSAGPFQTIGGTNVDIVGGSLYGYLCVSPESGNCIDMDGTGGNPQGVLQSVSAITLLPGQTYFLSFDLIGSQRGNTTSTTVTFGSYDQTFVLASGDDTSGIVTNAAINVGSPTSAFLTFTSNTPGQQGALLDDVTVTAGATTPEPQTWTLLLLGTLLLLKWSRPKFSVG
ncbi:MAG TPA: hypothetical protein VG206_20135 [Terriglobia bacterium]|nr:hypothetical protein [Terriglobia bacterium]